MTADARLRTKGFGHGTAHMYRMLPAHRFSRTRHMPAHVWISIKPREFPRRIVPRRDGASGEDSLTRFRPSFVHRRSLCGEAAFFSPYTRRVTEAVGVRNRYIPRASDRLLIGPAVGAGHSLLALIESTVGLKSQNEIQRILHLGGADERILSRVIVESEDDYLTLNFYRNSRAHLFSKCMRGKQFNPWAHFLFWFL